MTVEQHGAIDFVAYDPVEGVVLLVMVEYREWGEVGVLLPDLQERLNTYFLYATRGELVAHYPEFAGRPVRIELRASSAPGQRELEFLAIVQSRHLAPAGIQLAWRVIGEGGPQPM